MDDLTEIDALIRECGADLPSDRIPPKTDEEVTDEIMETLDELTLGLVK